ncbi:MAG: M1 family metallopeptidase [Fimbriimonadaceae bacterium]
MPGLLLLALVLARPPVDLATMKRLVDVRDVAGLDALLVAKPKGRSPFMIIKTGGAYGVGRFGWNPLELDPPKSDRRFVVFSTKLTSEDTGELLFEDTPKGLRYVPEDNSLGVSVVRHDFDVRFELASHGAVLRDRITLDATDAGLAFFRMGSEYRVDAIDGKHQFAQAGGVVALNLPAGRSTLNIAYHAIVNLPQFAASISTAEATLTNDYWYPMIARQPAPYAATIHAPVGWTAVAQGELVASASTKTEATFKYRMDLPVVYYSLTAGPFKPYVQTIDGRRFSVWSQAMTTLEKEEQTEFYAPIIKFYSDTFGKFPFSGYGAVVSKSYGGGALEAYSFATYGTGWLPDEDAHEPSHTWWGGIIPNTYLHSFWNESFADYSTGLFAQNVPIGNVAERHVAFIRHAAPSAEWNAAPIAQAGVDIGPPADALGYGKGSYVLDALENELGTKRMEATLRHWVASHSKDRAGEWEDYEQAVKESTGEDYTWFFDQWIRRSGYPKFDVTNAAYDGGAVTLQVQFDGAPYRMTAEILLQFADGRQAIKRVVIPPSPTSKLRIESAEKPTLVSFDPYRRLIRLIGSDEAPPTLSAAWRTFSRYAFGARASSVLSAAAQPGSSMPNNLNGVAIIGMPGDAPIIAELAAKAGFKLDGSNLTYDGTTIDLTHGAAEALIDLGGGHRCLLALGEPELRPNTGDAYLALTDHLGRFLRGKTYPKTSGRFVFQL